MSKDASKKGKLKLSRAQKYARALSAYWHVSFIWNGPPKKDVKAITTMEALDLLNKALEYAPSGSRLCAQVLKLQQEIIRGTSVEVAK